MRVTSKGQVTIPADIRRQAGLEPDAEVEFVVSGDEVVLRKARAKPIRGKALVDAVRGKARTSMTTDEIMALTRGE